MQQVKNRIAVEKNLKNASQEYSGWRLLLVFVSFLLFTLTIFALSVFAYFEFFLERTPVHPISLYALLSSPSSIAFQLLMMNLALLLAPCYLILRQHLSPKEVFSWRRTTFLNLICSAFMLLSSSILIDQMMYLVVETFLSGYALPSLSSNLSLGGIIENVDRTDLFSYNLLLFLTILSGPLAEELFFRGVLWNGFRQSYSFQKTLLLTSFFYALIHFDLLQGTIAFGSGCVLGYIIEKTKSVWCCMLAHVACSYLTFYLSNKNLSYGVGGMSYPPLVLIASFVTLLISGYLLFRHNRFRSSY